MEVRFDRCALPHDLLQRDGLVDAVLEVAIVVLCQLLFQCCLALVTLLNFEHQRLDFIFNLGSLERHFVEGIEAVFLALGLNFLVDEASAADDHHFAVAGLLVGLFYLLVVVPQLLGKGNDLLLWLIQVSNLRNSFEAVCYGHAQVEKHQVKLSLLFGYVAFADLGGLESVSCCLGFESCVYEQLLEDTQLQLVIVGNQALELSLWQLLGEDVFGLTV